MTMEIRKFLQEVAHRTSVDLEDLGVQPKLWCGSCGRNLSTPWGVALHTVFGDGSMRCYADDDHDYRSVRAFVRFEEVLELMDQAVATDRARVTAGSVVAGAVVMKRDQPSQGCSE